MKFCKLDKVFEKHVENRNREISPPQGTERR